MSSSATRPGGVEALIDAGQKRVLAVGFASLVVSAIIAVLARGEGNSAWLALLRDYLVAFVFVAGISLGCLGVLMIHHMTGGWWGYPLRRIFEAGARCVLLVVALFIPILLGMNKVYAQWVFPDPADSALALKAWYLNTHGFIVRAVVYFAIWIFLTLRLTSFSSREDATGDPTLTKKMEATSAPGLVIGALTVTIAAVDWVMSLQPDWYSTIWGFLFIVIFLMLGYSFSILAFNRLAVYEPLASALDPSRYLDVGNMLLTFTILWTYLSFSQFLIIWAGNMKDEIPFYAKRALGGWGVVGALLLLLHFFVPFFLLLQRSVKRKLPRLAKVALLQFSFELVDLYWLIVPSYQDRPRWADLGILFAALGLGGIFAGFFLGQLKRLPLLPLHDPRFPGHAPAIPPTAEFLHHRGPHRKEAET